MDLAYHRYGIKLRGVAGGNARSQRRVLEGFLIRADGGYGCLQPWPELGDGTLEVQWQALRSGGQTRLLRRALECAAVDAEARREGRSLFEGMMVPQSYATVTGSADFLTLKSEGFTGVKLKGGQNWQEILPRLRAAVEAGLRVRIDFNGLLSEQGFRELTQAAKDVRTWVDYVEDPMPYNPRAWEQLRRETGWHLGLDRVADGTEATGGFDVRILKPAVDGIGPLHDCPSISTVVTSYMDHAVGQAFAAWEAGRFGGRQGLAGLMTHRLFEPDAFTGRFAAAGPDWLGPGGTGLGFDDLLEGLPWVPIRPPRKRTAGQVLQNPRDPLPGGGPKLKAGQIGFATSGSTGTPSVVVHTRQTLETSARAVNNWLATAASDVWLRVLPDFHVGGYQIGVRAMLSGSRIISDEAKWDAQRFVKAVGEEAVTLSALVPAQVVDLVKRGLRAPAGIRAVMVGGGPLDEQQRLAALALGWPLLRTYGATETASQVATECIGAAGDLMLLPHWEARVMPAAGLTVANDKAGLLELRGAALALGRFVRKEQAWLWHKLPDAAGWWQTADQVILSGRKLTFLGRADRVVKVLGELVNLEAVEAALVSAGLIDRAFAVLAVPDVRRGVELVLVVERESGGQGTELNQSGSEPKALTREGGTPTLKAEEAGAAMPQRGDVNAALTAYTAGAAPFARISRIFEVDALPRSPLGKVKPAAAATLISRRPTL